MSRDFMKEPMSDEKKAAIILGIFIVILAAIIVFAVIGSMPITHPSSNSSDIAVSIISRG